MASSVCPACDLRFDPTLPACPACGAVPFRPEGAGRGVDWDAVSRRRTRCLRLGLVGGLLLGAVACGLHFATTPAGRYPWLTVILLMGLGLAGGVGSGLVVSMAMELNRPRRYGDGKSSGPQNPFSE